MCDNEILSSCRICMKESSQPILLLNYLYSEKSVTILEALGVVMGCQISMEDILPNCLCSVCFVHLQISYNLKKQYFETQKKLLDNKLKIELEIHQDELIIKDEIVVDLPLQLAKDSIKGLDNASVMPVTTFGMGKEKISMDVSEEIPEGINGNISETDVENNDTCLDLTNPINGVDSHGKTNDSCVMKGTRAIYSYKKTTTSLSTTPKQNIQLFNDDSTISENGAQIAETPMSSSKSTKRIMCDFCEFSTDIKYILRRHVVSVHHSPMVYKCKMCPHITYSLNHQELHMDMKHRRQSKCPHCAFKTHSIAAMTNHLKWRHNDPIRKNPIQTQAISKENDVEVLEISSDEENSQPNEEPVEIRIKEVFSLSDNNKNSSKNSDNLMKFVRVNGVAVGNALYKVNRYDFVCGVCNFVGDCCKTFIQHGKSRHPGLPRLKCSLCSYRTFSRKHFNKHNRIIHP